VDRSSFAGWIRHNQIWVIIILQQNNRPPFDHILYGYRYITRYNVKDSSRHIILGTQQFKPSGFGAQVMAKKVSTISNSLFTLDL